MKCKILFIFSLFIFFILVFGCTDLQKSLLKQEKSPVLVLGQSSPELLNELYKNYDLIIVTQRSPDLEGYEKDFFNNFKIIILDQSTEPDGFKLISAKMGKAIQEYVNEGGSLITVMDSGIYQQDAYDVIGWKPTFGDIIPVNCNRVNDIPSCTQKIVVYGKLYVKEKEHPILWGIDGFPVLAEDNATFETFDVTPDGNELAYLKDAKTQKTYPAIVEKKMIAGKSIYFNYNPGFTSATLRNTIMYLLEIKHQSAS